MNIIDAKEQLKQHLSAFEKHLDVSENIVKHMTCDTISSSSTSSFSSNNTNYNRWPGSFFLWFSGDAPTSNFGFSNSTGCQKQRKTPGAKVQLYQVQAIEQSHPRPDPVNHVRIARNEGYTGLCLDAEGWGVVKENIEAYWNECKKYNFPFIPAPRYDLFHQIHAFGETRNTKWEKVHYLDYNRKDPIIIAAHQRVAKWFNDHSDGLCLWFYSAGFNQWDYEVTEIRKQYKKQLWCMGADGNNRSVMTSPEENIRIAKHLWNTYGEVYGIFFPHKDPDLSRWYASKLNGMYQKRPLNTTDYKNLSTSLENSIPLEEDSMLRFSVLEEINEG